MQTSTLANFSLWTGSWYFTEVDTINNSFTSAAIPPCALLTSQSDCKSASMLLALICYRFMTGLCCSLLAFRVFYLSRCNVQMRGVEVIGQT